MARHRFPKTLSPAFLLSLLALFVAAAGTATAGRALITGRDIKDGSVQLADLSPKARKALTAKSTQADFARQASFATDAGAATVVRDWSNPTKVIKASTTPIRGNMLALGSDGRFPISVMPNVAARVYSSTDEPFPLQIAFGPVKNLTFDRVSFDTAGLFDPAHPTRLTAPVSGVYLITTSVSWQVSPASGNNRAVYVWVNGRAISVDQRPPADETRQTVTTIYRLRAGDDVEVGLGQDGSDTLIANAVGDYAPSLAMALIAQG